MLAIIDRQYIKMAVVDGANQAPKDVLSTYILSLLKSGTDVTLADFEKGTGVVFSRA